MTWSRIQNTELATEAYVLMNENAINGCVYHNNDHIEDMYSYLEDTNEPYDEALDWAIMFHDVVYDELPEKELRSARLFVEMCNKFRGFNLRPSEQARVYSLIMRTRTHEINPIYATEAEKAIIRADLHALTSKVKTVDNFTKIMKESIMLYGCTLEEFAENNIKFMEGLHQRMGLNILAVEDEEKLFYQFVQNGINLAIRLAQAIKDSK
jgi:predicted metal-dependent HD superfamily phosphohydrolase